jgi:colicin import membrane protein
MTRAKLDRDTLLPRPPQGMGPGLMLALLVHLGLVIAIAFAVRWRASEPAGIEAELWAAVPQIAAPKAVMPEPQPVPKAEPPPPPPPPPTPKAAEPEPDAQIAIEKARRDEAERVLKQQEAERVAQQRREEEARKLAQQRQQEQEEKVRKEQEDKLRKDQEEKLRKEQEQKRLAAVEKDRKKNLERLMAQAGATGDPTSKGTAERTAGSSAGYAGRIRARIKPNIVYADSSEGNPLAEIELRLAPDGTILSQKLIKPSGLKEWDDAVQRAIDRTQVLPRDIDGSVPSTMVIAFRPKD